MFQPYCFVLAPLNPFFIAQIDVPNGLKEQNDVLSSHQCAESTIKQGQQWQKAFNSRIIDISCSIKENLEKTNEIITLLDRLNKNFESIQEEFNSIRIVPYSHEKESSLQNYTQESESTEKGVASKVLNNRTHPKIKLMENIFGKKQYPYKLVYDGKFPKILFKQRNISVKILLKNKMGENVINGNQISLNLKVYKNNGEQIVSDSPDHCFVQGLCQTQIKSGVGVFSKIHPRQVSKGFSGKGISIIIYATSQQNQTNEQGLRIQASEIQPLIFYNVKVVVKQNKFLSKTHKQTAFDLDHSN